MVFVLQHKLPSSLTFQEEVQFTDIVCDNGFYCTAEKKKKKKPKNIKSLGTVIISPNFGVIFVDDVVVSLIFKKQTKIKNNPSFLNIW